MAEAEESNLDGESRKREREPVADGAAVANGEGNGEGNHGESRKRVKESEKEKSAEDGGEVVLTEQEAAVYDRQIRIWGVEAQKRLSKVRVLAVGMSGVIAETCKNIVLAGIGSLTIMDDRPVTAEAALTNFLIYPDDIGGERSTGAVCAGSLKEYNPMVNVGFKTGNIADKPEEFFDNFDVVVLDKAPLRLKKHVNAVCRSRPQKLAFYAVDCRYSCGGFFVDLQTITYTYKKIEGAEPTQSTKTFPSLEDALSVRLGSLPQKRTSQVFFASRIVDEFEQRKELQPGQISSEDSASLLEFAREYLQAQGTSLSKPVEKVLQTTADAGSTELPPVSAIIGGILGQEIVKALSCKGEPLRNYFFFDTSDGKGIIEDISAQLPPIPNGPKVVVTPTTGTVDLD